MIEEPSQSRLELLYEISRELVSSLDLNIVLSRVLSLSTRNVGAERGMLIALDEYKMPIEGAIIYQQELKPHSEDQLLTILQSGLAGWVVNNRKSVLIPDTSKDSRWLKRPDDAADRSGAKSAICIPILVAKEILVGVLTIVHPVPGFFGEEHFAFLQAIADQASIAIYNANLYHSLEAAHLRYRELFEDSGDPIFITDRKGTIVEANRKAVETSGCSIFEITQKKIQELHDVDWGVIGENFVNLYKRFASFNYESVLKHKDKFKDIPVEVYVHLIQIGGEDNFQWIFRDISERKDLESLQDDLIAMIYHDLRSPLSNVISSLDMLKVLLPNDLDPSIGQVFNIASRSANRVKRLASSLLDIHRLEAGQSIVNRQSVVIDILVNEAVEIVKPASKNKRQKIELEIQDKLPLINVDEDMIRRVLVNLLENATKFTPSDGLIILKVSKHNDLVKFVVQDSGPGIPEQERDKIFYKFEQLRTENVPRGIGLGLAFCRMAVIAHGGKIWVESEEGNGSSFQFTLPVEKNTK